MKEFGFQTKQSLSRNQSHYIARATKYSSLIV